jgi:predicted RNA-binding protein associated with RNAse of E/G family
MACLLGEDEFGRWLGIKQGDPWWAANDSRSGVYIAPLVKLVVEGAYWSVCFQPIDPVVDVDIVLPARWGDGVLEEVDLELDVLRFADGRVIVRDWEEFELLRTVWGLPAEVGGRAKETAAWVQARLEEGAEPFATVGSGWLRRFMVDACGER